MQNPLESEEAAFRFVLGAIVYFVPIVVAAWIATWLGVIVFVATSVLAFVALRRGMASAPAVVSTERAAVDDTPLGVTSWLDDPEAIAEQYESEDALTQRVLAHRELVVGPDDEVRERIREARPWKDTGSISPRRPESPDRRGLPVPFTLRNIKKDLDDIGSAFNGAPELEFRAATKALQLEKAALSYQYVPPGYRFPYGHTHETQEEVYVVVRGSGRMKLDDEVVELEAWDAVRVPPGTWRGYEAGPEGLEILVIGAPNLGEDPRDDVDGERDWWAG